MSVTKKLERRILRAAEPATSSELEVLREKGRQESLRWFHAATIAKTLIHTTGFVLCFYMVKGSIESLSGKQTIASIVVGLAAEMQANKWISYAIAALCGGAWFRERNLRKKKVKELTEHSARLERLVDPSRTSSQLTPDGNSRPEDRL